MGICFIHSQSYDETIGGFCYQCAAGKSPLKTVEASGTSTYTASYAIALLKRAYKTRIDDQWLSDVKTFLEGQRQE